MQRRMTGVTDLEIYLRLAAIVEELDTLAARGPSFAGGAALNTASRTLRGMAAALYEHSISAGDEEPNA
jgi:hypothetical protein